MSNCLYLIGNRKKWGDGAFVELYGKLKTFTQNKWWVGKLKKIDIGMKGIAKIAADKNSNDYYEKRNSKKLNAGIYCTFKVIKKPENGWIEIEIIDNFFKMGKIIDKNDLIELLGVNYFEAQRPRYLDCALYEKVKSFGIELNSNLIPDIIAEELSEEDVKNLPEGAKKEIIVNTYERNPEARKKCIEKYGYICCVCEFDFEKKYGEIGKGFIHVHHLKSLSEIKEEYIINPVEDLRPVCPNCHAMLHKRNPPYSIEEGKKFIL